MTNSEIVIFTVLNIITLAISLFAIVYCVFIIFHMEDNYNYVKEIVDEYLEDLDIARQASRKLEKILLKIEQAEDDVARRTNK